MKSAAVILLVCLLFADVKGMVLTSKGRCQCLDGGAKFIPRKLIAKVEVYYPSLSCQRTEIIVTLKEKDQQKCLNPESKLAKNLIKNAKRTKRSLW